MQKFHHPAHSLLRLQPASVHHMESLPGKHRKKYPVWRLSFLGVIPYSSAISLCDRICHNDRYRIIGSRNIHSSYQKSHTKLSALLSAENFMDPAKKCIKSTILTYQRTHGSYQNRHHTGLKHSGYTGSHICQKISTGVVCPPISIINAPDTIPVRIPQTH